MTADSNSLVLVNVCGYTLATSPFGVRTTVMGITDGNFNARATSPPESWKLAK